VRAPPGDGVGGARGRQMRSAAAGGARGCRPGRPRSTQPRWVAACAGPVPGGVVGGAGLRAWRAAGRPVHGLLGVVAHCGTAGEDLAELGGVLRCRVVSPTTSGARFAQGAAEDRASMVVAWMTAIRDTGCGERPCRAGSPRGVSAISSSRVRTIRRTSCGPVRAAGRAHPSCLRRGAEAQGGLGAGDAGRRSGQVRAAARSVAARGGQRWGSCTSTVPAAAVRAARRRGRAVGHGRRSGSSSRRRAVVGEDLRGVRRPGDQAAGRASSQWGRAVDTVHGKVLLLFGQVQDGSTPRPGSVQSSGRGRGVFRCARIDRSEMCGHRPTKLNSGLWCPHARVYGPVSAAAGGRERDDHGQTQPEEGGHEPGGSLIHRRCEAIPDDEACACSP
jgi:hypothetical protein